MGVVVAAHHLELDCVVALKFMLPQALSFPQAAQRFMREGQVLQRFESENMTRVLDTGVLENGAPYFAMEYVDGLELSKLVRQYGALSINDSVDFVLQACKGVAEAHRCGVVHRDLKPGNLLLTQRPDGSTLIKVLDFGLSKLLSEEEDDEPSVSQTQTTGTMGTPAYMSPEQARSAKYVDERADVWSLGAILYHLLTASLPFPAQATAEAFAKLLYDEPVPLRETSPWVPAELEEIILRCLRKDPDERFQNVAEFVAALEPFAAGGAYYESPPAPQDSVIIDGPKDLDVPSVLQQRTTLSFDSMDVVVGNGMSPDLVVNLPTVEPRQKRTGKRTAILAAVAGMIVGGCLIAAAVLFLGGRWGAAQADAEQPQNRDQAGEAAASSEARVAPSIPARSGEGAGSPLGEDDGEDGDTSEVVGNGEDSDDEAGDDAIDGEDDDAIDGEDDDAVADRDKRKRARKKNKRRKRAKNRRKDSSGGDGEAAGEKKSRPKAVKPDPFGTIH